MTAQTFNPTPSVKGALDLWARALFLNLRKWFGDKTIPDEVPAEYMHYLAAKTLVLFSLSLCDSEDDVTNLRGILDEAWANALADYRKHKKTAEEAAAFVASIHP